MAGTMVGRLVLVTGGTGGIGKETARGVAAQGATVVIVGRDAERGGAVARALQTATGNHAISYMQADLSHRAGVDRLADEFQARHDRLDVLVNNAGGIFWSRQETADGLEMTFGLNHLSYFHLTHHLLPLLRASAPARIINVSSAAHRGATMRFDDLHQVRKYSAWGAYAQSKLANILFTRELARRLAGSGVTANVLHPGFVATNFGRGGGLIGRLLMPLAQLFAISPEAGAETSIYLATAPELSGVNGRYFVGTRPAQPSRAATDDRAARELWARSLPLAAIQEPYGDLLERAA